jgi:hypothetical protein
MKVHKELASVYCARLVLRGGRQSAGERIGVAISRPDLLKVKLISSLERPTAHEPPAGGSLPAPLSEFLGQIFEFSTPLGRGASPQPHAGYINPQIVPQVIGWQLVIRYPGAAGFPYDRVAYLRS